MKDRIESKSKFTVSHRKRYRHGVAWHIGATFALQGSTFVVNVILANILGRQQFGEFGMVQTTLLTVGSIAQLATGVTATKYIAEYRDADPGRAGRILGLCFDVSFLFGFLGLTLLLVTADWLSEGFLKAPHLGDVIYLGAASVLFSALNGYQLGALAGLGSYRTLALAALLQSVVYVLSCSALGLVYGVSGAAAALAIASAARWAIYAVVLNRELRLLGLAINRRDAWRERFALWHFTIPSAITGLTSMPAIWFTNALLARQADGFSELGVYGAAVIIKNMMLLVPQVFNNVGMTFLNNFLGAGDSRSYWSIYRVNLIISGVTMGVGIAVLALTGRWALSVFGPQFSIGYDVLLILLLSSFFEALAIAVYQIVQSSGRMWLSFFAVALPRDLLFVGLSCYFVPLYGASGLAMAYAGAWFVAFWAIMLVAGNVRKKLSLQFA